VAARSLEDEEQQQPAKGALEATTRAFLDPDNDGQEAKETITPDGRCPWSRVEVPLSYVGLNML
jgi:hypothetical protein